MDSSLLRDLPSALLPEYIQRLLDENGVREFCFESKTPRDMMDAVNAHRGTVSALSGTRCASGCRCWRRSAPIG